jgi:hypothetical protein
MVKRGIILATMKSLIYILSLVIFFGCGCGEKTNVNHIDTLVIKKDSVDARVHHTILKGDSSKANSTKASDFKRNWAGRLIENYIANTDNELVKLTRKEKTPEEWLFDQTINTDTTKYFVFEIGHDVFDESHTNMRFAPDAWIYIDSLTKKIYEYKNESLTEWKK